MKFMTSVERDDWNAMLDEVNGLPGLSTGERSQALIDRLLDAEQAHVKWARPAMRALAVQSCGKALKARAKATDSTLVTFSTAAAVRTMRVGVKARNTKGATAFQQKLFEEMTWVELREHAALLTEQMRAMGISLAVDRKVMRLHEMVPNSIGPGDAALQLGTTVAAYLAQEVA